jgi:putative SOS response-associated peptidase YedK
MCGRYRRTTSEEELARRYHIPIPPQRDLPISWNIAPTQDVLAIRLNPESKQRTLDALRWGLIPNRAKDPKIAYKRVETVDTAPAREPEIALTGNVRQPAGLRLQTRTPQLPG